MLCFHTTVHARSPNVVADKVIELAGRKLQTLSVPQEALAAPFAISFEEAGAALAKLERLFFEPDGSFVWTSSNDQPRWQVDGNLFDRAGRLLFVDLKGACPADQFDRLLSAFGWPTTSVMFQMMREAIFLDEAEFRRVAGQSVIGPELPRPSAD